ncbi:glycerophosphodiester phosphodiesterase [Sphaerochaeta sp. PS]|uniref:glycerophosphodiester phosphodiesterase n=1 Tax=Sphaerochaeta sp. PS TaxID=3076336 RepID=UPI0028A4C7F4|nr:glycerophosphodiester phosphodiesterase [Sphaerochaeta sp. PS]MDT4761950.1 glycerophosphodiester phosphodiesterase [Sphaerochaeta sp. PS]
MFKSFFDPLPRVVAHRGDSAHYPENTLEAFLSAYRMGVDVIETDVHLSKDGFLVIWHDETLERNTNGTGRIEDHTLEELKRFDAGYTFTTDGGKSFPFRAKGVVLCTLDEALRACPAQRFNVDLKTRGEAIVDAFIKVLDENQAKKRVVGASFHYINLRLLRRKEPRILTSITSVEVRFFLFLYWIRLLPKKLSKSRQIIFQVPPRQGYIVVITPSFVKAMHKRGAIIQVWTINERSEMERLFAMGVDSVMTDKPALALEVAQSMGLLTTPDGEQS